jgi:uncharacterized protein involved in exopolysaccharide biosynthesis
VLQTLGSNDGYETSEPIIGADRGSSLGSNDYLEIFKRRFFYFLIPFILASIPGLYVAAIQKPTYLSEGTILLEAQTIASDIVQPVISTRVDDRLQSIQQRITTRDTLLSIANKFDLFPARSPSDVAENMRKDLQIRPADVGGQPRQGGSVGFKLGFEYQSPELAKNVASEFIALLVGEDTRSRTNQVTEAVKMLTDQANDIESKLESTQTQLLEIARRPRDDVGDTDQQSLELSALKDLAALKAELVQKSAVYSDAHPAIVALKKKVAAMEKSITQPSRAQTQSQSRAAEMEALKRQREALETRLADANKKLASARLGQNQEQRTERIEVIEPPSLPQKPIIKYRLKTFGMMFAGAAVLGLAVAIGFELLDGSIRNPKQLAGVVAGPLLLSIPYLATPADVMRRRLKIVSGFIGAALILFAWGGLATAVVLNLPLIF